MEGEQALIWFYEDRRWLERHILNKLIHLATSRFFFFFFLLLSNSRAIKSHFFIFLSFFFYMNGQQPKMSKNSITTCPKNITTEYESRFIFDQEFQTICHPTKAVTYGAWVDDLTFCNNFSTNAGGKGRAFHIVLHFFFLREDTVGIQPLKASFETTSWKAT